ncbi:hypothetical protein Bbelb_394010 [Branchiostoma belcheri]|nr:hypothetical protein Bbelb_394010 [Branchiostoma belcheri]
MYGAGKRKTRAPARYALSPVDEPEWPSTPADKLAEQLSTEILDVSRRIERMKVDMGLGRRTSESTSTPRRRTRVTSSVRGRPSQKPSRPNPKMAVTSFFHPELQFRSPSSQQIAITRPYVRCGLSTSCTAIRPRSLSIFQDRQAGPRSPMRYEARPDVPHRSTFNTSSTTTTTLPPMRLWGDREARIATDSKPTPVPSPRITWLPRALFTYMPVSSVQDTGPESMLDTPPSSVRTIRTGADRVVMQQRGRLLPD